MENSLSNYQYHGQALQDQFVVKVLKGKKHDYFVELGSEHPIIKNNTYVLEKELDWTGIMIDKDSQYLDLYKSQRLKSYHIIDDAAQIDYLNLFKECNMPRDIGYLQIDLEVNNASTLFALRRLNRSVMDLYRFATITFEHDAYRDFFYCIKQKSRAIFQRRGYVLVFPDVMIDGHKNFEDWYVHPDLVDMEYINKIKREVSLDYTEIMKIL